MAPSVRLRAPTEADILECAANMRAEDAAEVLASEGSSPIEAVCFGVRYSKHSAALLIDGKVACIFGVTPLTGSEPETALGEPAVGNVWLLSTYVVEKHPKTFLRMCHRILPVLAQAYPCLFQAVDARYTRAVRWLAHLGFEVGPPMPFGTEGLLFHPVRFRRHSWVGPLH